MKDSIWATHTFNGNKYYLLDFDHPQVEKDIIGEMDSGVDVYYDLSYSKAKRSLLQGQGSALRRWL
jgi:hypothetical protein